MAPSRTTDSRSSRIDAVLPENYVGREQTYVKHIFLQGYLEKVAFHIGWTRNKFIYVDGFSGPWKSQNE
jgi:hypothetical protein